jgi:hypothetical protein
MRHNVKLLFTGIFIMFLMAIFFLFAAIKNASAGSALTYTSIFLTLVSGSLLYGMSIRRQETKDASILADNQAQIDETASNNQEITVNENVKADDDQIDIQKLLPSRTLGIEKYAEELLHNMAGSFKIVQGLFYIKNPNEDLFHCYAQYAYFSENKPVEFRTGETLPGQAVKNKAIVSLSNIPDQYMTIASGLGKSNPNLLVFVPIKSQDEVIGLIEYATFEQLTENQFTALESISKKIADMINKHFKK